MGVYHDSISFSGFSAQSHSTPVGLLKKMDKKMFPVPDTEQIQKRVQAFHCLHAVCRSDYYFIVSGGSNESLRPDRALFSVPALSTCIYEQQQQHYHHHNPIATFITIF